MDKKKKEPLPAKGAARIDNQDRRDPDSVNIKTGTLFSNSGTLQKDAKVLQFLKKECVRTGAGHEALQRVFTGLLSVHNRQLSSFANALAEVQDGE